MFPFRTTAPTLGSPVVTMVLIVANISVFLYQIGLSAQAEQVFIYTHALVPAVYSHPELARGAGFNPDNYLPFVTNTFMHAGFLHLILNMWTLWLFGAPLEDRLGRWRFLALYMACGTVGSVGHLAFNLQSTVPALGASGAVAGVLGGYTLFYPRAKVALVQPIFFFPLVFHLPAMVFTGLWFAFQVLGGAAVFTADAGSAGGGIAWWAHIAGFLAGLGLVWAMGRSRPAPTPPAPPRSPGPAPPRQGRKWQLPDVGSDKARDDTGRDPGPWD
jgi:membrane associated rhomboid family serine protease